MFHDTTSYVRLVNGQVFVFEHVPATICELCGERAFSGPTLDTIARMSDERPTPSRVAEASIYDLAEMPARHSR